MKKLRTNVTCCSVAKLCPTLCNPINCSLPGFSVHHYLPEFAQTHVHWVDDAFQPSQPLSPPSLSALNLYQHQGLFQWFSNSHEVAKGWSFSFSISPYNEYSGLISFRIDWLDLAVQGLLKRLLQQPLFKSINSLALNLLYGSTVTSVRDCWKNHNFDYTDLCWQTDISGF